ncbi:MAG TPA: hypothetical protein VGD68_05580 [Streptosporangiaceae bacterium]
MRRLLSGLAMAAAMTGSAAGLAGPAVGAPASTARCTGGSLQPQCGDFVNQSGNGWAVFRQRLQPNTPVIAYPDFSAGQQITSDPATDFYVFTPAWVARQNRSFEYAPGGILSGLCLADPDNPNLVKPHGLVLRWCNGSSFQQWQASEGNGSAHSVLWRNVASRGWIQPDGTGQQLTASWSAGPVPGAYWAWNTPGTPPR